MLIGRYSSGIWWCRRRCTDFHCKLYEGQHEEVLKGTEKRRRSDLYSKIVSRGPNYVSSSYGNLNLTLSGNFNWTNYELLVPNVIPSSAKAGGSVLLKYGIGEKLKSQYDGVLTPVTVLQAGPCVVTQVKTVENDGYDAVQVGFADIKEKLVSKPVKGQFDKAEVPYKRFLREFKFENASEYSVKDEIKADIFAAGDKVDATAISKGKGFQGAIKRFGQHRGPMAHGSKFHRHQGSNGACSSPSKVFKGKGMPGHMGCVKVTVQNLEVVKVDAEKNLLLVKGSVPGPKKALVTIKETTRVEA